MQTKKYAWDSSLVPFRNNIIRIKFRSRCHSALRKKDKRRLAEAPALSAVATGGLSFVKFFQRFPSVRASSFLFSSTPFFHRSTL